MFGTALPSPHHIGDINGSDSVSRLLLISTDDEHSLRAGIQRVLVRGVAAHAVVRDLARVRDGVAPEGLRIDGEVADGAPRDARERERDGPSVAVFARAVGKEGPPRLAVALDPARAVCVNDEVAPGDDKP